MGGSTNGMMGRPTDKRNLSRVAFDFNKMKIIERKIYPSNLGVGKARRLFQWLDTERLNMSYHMSVFSSFFVFFLHFLNQH